MKNMKKLQFTLLLLFAFAFSQQSIAQHTTAQNKEVRNKGTINASDKTATVITHNDLKYYVIDGIWYGKFKNKYVLRQAPEGARIDYLPQDGEMVTITGINYYKCKGVFYKKIKKDLYEVARP